MQMRARCPPLKPASHTYGDGGVFVPCENKLVFSYSRDGVLCWFPRPSSVRPSVWTLVIVEVIVVLPGTTLSYAKEPG